MRIAFMGSPEFAADILEDIHENMEIVVVYTREDAVRSRGKQLLATPVKVLAQALGIEVRTPKTLRDEAEQDYLRSLGLDAIVVAAYGRILPKEVLDIPRFGCINVHASLLPRWRGAAPIERAILAGDEFAGVCIMRMEEGLDTGDFCVSRSIPIADMNAATLTSELASLGAVSLITALDHIEHGCARWVVQDENEVTYASKIEKGELDLSCNMDVEDAIRCVRASGVAHPAKCVVADRVVTLLEADKVDDVSVIKSTGDVLHAGDVAFVGKKLYLICNNGALVVDSLKPDGKSAMDGKAFAAGNKDIREGRATWSGIDGC
ncbi:MAG: methionyl-tRNA formyltransferase [Eggerthellaceae bacterium]|nr:methionyl-tRNA formyltransferase [Eggerthellaceae bacterium]